MNPDSIKQLVEDRKCYVASRSMLTSVEDHIVEAQSAANAAMSEYMNAFAFDPGIHREFTMLQLALSHAWGAMRAAMVKLEDSTVMTAKVEQ